MEVRCCVRYGSLRGSLPRTGRVSRLIPFDRSRVDASTQGGHPWRPQGSSERGSHRTNTTRCARNSGWATRHPREVHPTPQRSVRTERHAAPFFSYVAAIRAGSKSARINPRLGLARLISAMTAGFDAAIFARNARSKPRGAEADRARRSISSGVMRCFASSTSRRLAAMMRSRMALTQEPSRRPA